MAPHGTTSCMRTEPANQLPARTVRPAALARTKDLGPQRSLAVMGLGGPVRG